MRSIEIVIPPSAPGVLSHCVPICCAAACVMYAWCCVTGTASEPAGMTISIAVTWSTRSGERHFGGTNAAHANAPLNVNLLQIEVQRCCPGKHSPAASPSAPPPSPLSSTSRPVHQLRHARPHRQRIPVGDTGWSRAAASVFLRTGGGGGAGTPGSCVRADGRSYACCRPGMAPALATTTRSGCSDCACAEAQAVCQSGVFGGGAQSGTAASMVCFSHSRSVASERTLRPLLQGAKALTISITRVLRPVVSRWVHGCSAWNPRLPKITHAQSLCLEFKVSDRDEVMCEVRTAWLRWKNLYWKLQVAPPCCCPAEHSANSSGTDSASPCWPCRSRLSTPARLADTACTQKPV